jgi:hypothetical protein
VPCRELKKKKLPRELRTSAIVLQLSVASKVLVFQICRADRVPQLLKEFLKDTTIRFCGAAIDNDVHMLRLYKIEILSVYDLQKIIPNPTKNPILSLYDLSNSTIGTKLEKNKTRRRRTTRNENKKMMN